VSASDLLVPAAVIGALVVLWRVILSRFGLS
jgi:hypothetical protein